MLSHVQLFMTPWTVALLAPMSMESLGKNTGVACHFLLQEIIQIQGLNPLILHVLHWQAEFLPLCPLGSLCVCGCVCVCVCVCKLLLIIWATRTNSVKNKF